MGSPPPATESPPGRDAEIEESERLKRKLELEVLTVTRDKTQQEIHLLRKPHRRIENWFNVITCAVAVVALCLQHVGSIAQSHTDKLQADAELAEVSKIKTENERDRLARAVDVQTETVKNLERELSLKQEAIERAALQLVDYHNRVPTWDLPRVNRFLGEAGVSVLVVQNNSNNELRASAQAMRWGTTSPAADLSDSEKRIRTAMPGLGDAAGKSSQSVAPGDSAVFMVPAKAMMVSLNAVAIGKDVHPGIGDDSAQLTSPSGIHRFIWNGTALRQDAATTAPAGSGEGSTR